MLGWLVFAFLLWLGYLFWWSRRKKAETVQTEKILADMAAPREARHVFRWPGSDEFAIAVAGVAHYQPAIVQAATFDGKVHSRYWPARLVPVSDNPHDHNAVKVTLGGRHVGYLPKRLAQAFRAELQRRLGAVVETECYASLVVDERGYEHSVWLDLEFLKKRQKPAPSWPDGRPMKSEALADGRTAHSMADGRTLSVPAEALYRFEYEGRTDGDSYFIDVSIIGLSGEPGYVETWNHGMSKVRSYAFHKILGITNLKSGEVHTGEQLCKQLGGEMLE